MKTYLITMSVKIEAANIQDAVYQLEHKKEIRSKFTVVEDKQEVYNVILAHLPEETCSLCGFTGRAESDYDYYVTTQICPRCKKKWHPVKKENWVEQRIEAQ